MSKETIKVVEINTDPAKKSIKDLRKEIMELKNQMANLEEGGDEFLEVANKAGELKHQLDEINESVKGASADFGDMVGNISNVAAGLVGAFSAVAGGLQAIGVESTAIDETIKRMQGLMAVVQGLSSIDTAIKSLDKLRNSITATSGAAKVLKTVLQPKVFLAITAVIAALTAAWNLWGDSIKETFPFLGKTTKQLEEEKKAAEAAAKAKEKQAEEEKNYAKKVGTAIQDTLSSYKLLQGQYNRLQTDYQKLRWIEKNKDEFNKLGLSVKNLKEAEDTFVGNTDKVVRALIKRAIATAKQQQLTELAAQYMEAQTLAEQEYERQKVSAGSIVYGNSHTTEGGFEQLDRNGRWVFTQKGAERFNQQLKQRIYAQAETLRTQMDDLAEDIAAEMSIDNIIGGGSTGGSGNGSKKIDEATQTALNAIDIKIEELKRTYNVGSKEFNDSAEKQKEYLTKVKEQEDARLKLLEKGTVEYARQETLIYNLGIEISEVGQTTTETVDEDLETLKELAKQWKVSIQTPQEWYDQELAILDKLKEQKLLTDEEYIRASKQLYQEFADWQKELDNEVLLTKQEKAILTAQVAASAFSAIGSIMSELASNENAETKESFEKQKQLQIGAATMSMLTGIINAWTSAMALPSPWNVIQGAIDTAATLALGTIQINKIKQQQFGGSSPSPSSSAVNATIVPPVQYSQAVQGASTEGAIQNQKVYVTESDIVDTIGKVSVQETENTY